MNSENCVTMSFGPVFIAFSSSLSLDLSAFASSVMLSTDNLTLNKQQCQRFNSSSGTPLLRSCLSFPINPCEEAKFDLGYF